MLLGTLLDEHDLQAWLAGLHREDVRTSKRLQEESRQGRDELSSLWLALPQDTRPPAPAGRHIAPALRGGFQRDLTTRESKIEYVFKDLFQKHHGELVAVSSEWRSVRGPIPAELVSGQFLVPVGRHDPPPAFGGGPVRDASKGGKRGRGNVADGPTLGDCVSSLAEPDRNRPNYYWVRLSEVTTWIRLVEGLGRDFTAEALHAFFRSCDLITTKKPSHSGAGSQLRTTQKFFGERAARGGGKFAV